MQKPHPPIIFGGESDPALRRVAELGQGWYGFNLLPDEAAARLAALERLLVRRGRDRRSVEVTVCPYMKPGRDAASLRAYGAAGVDQVVYLVTAPTADGVRAEIEKLAATLLPVAAALTGAR
jgi:alkanesulfonate monooxygenase SsuD/methylene tetrahydromethanopterin reductase-like flavin-dependent oxidoreductase (luciferase family)